MARRRFPNANLPRESREWTREVENFITEQDARNEKADSSGVNASKSAASTAQRQGDTIRQIPFQINGYDTQSGFGLVDGWNVVAAITIEHPAGWDRVTFTAIGGAAVLDDVSGGLTIAQARIRIGTAASPTFSPAKDAGASKVNNILNPQFGVANLDATAAGSTQILLELTPVNPVAFPAAISNYSSLVVQAFFSNTSA